MKMKKLTTQAKLDKLRQLMKNVGADYYYVPSTDPHHSEMVPTIWTRRQWITGFTGSAGDAMIGLNAAYLWTDGRYAIQAEKQLNPTYFKFFIQGTSNYASINNWLQDYAKNKIVATDPKLLSIAKAQEYKRILDPIGGKLVPFIENFVDMAQGGFPPLPNDPVILHKQQYAGQKSADKLKQLRLALLRTNCDTHVISSLDDIAWLFNIRSRDVPYTPVAISYAIITHKTATLYIHLAKLSAADQQSLAAQGITVKAYETFGEDLSAINNNVLIDKYTTSWWVQRQLTSATLTFAALPTRLLKAKKNAVELAGMKEAHRRDGAAVIRFLHWLELNWTTGVDELSAAKMLATFRQDNALFQDLSFGTISGFAENSAIIHYQPTKKTNKTIDDQAIYLVDSGGQYLDGTTDITRTIHLGKPTPEEKKHYTLVLKGHLALRHAVFVESTTGEQLDVLARQFLWRAGLNYPHGTGHGVGHYLGVHEGPQSISPMPSNIPLEPGMVTSNEPGIYFANRYGIRVENVCAVTRVNGPINAKQAANPFFTFEDLTVVPYAKNLMDLSLLSDQELTWINDYHTLVLRRVLDELPEETGKWLKKATAPIRR